MSSNVLYGDTGFVSYFDLQKFENAISNKTIKREQRIAVRKKCKKLDRLIIVLTFLSIVCLMFIGLSIAHQNIIIYEKDKKIKRLETTLSKKVYDNSGMVEEIKDAIKFDNLKLKAYMDLNMITPTEKSVIYFDKSDAGYVRQYENIR